MPKFLTDLAEKFRQRSVDMDSILNLILVDFNIEPYALILCRDGQLKFWSCIKGNCMAIVNILTENDVIGSDHVQNGKRLM